ncbi:MAG: class I SAM-dependent methyltransferase [Halochromatium sp.]|uniref:class I SAM-dependent methyltransferase n=1 Tax=Halochromatium sp. TaxID=2049430 RepID=UPI00397A5597
MSAKGSAFSSNVIKIAKANAKNYGLSSSLFKSHSIYDLDSAQDRAEFIVCCEVLEHLENPEARLKALQIVARKYLIVTVPQEPLWSALNLARGKCIKYLGNTPGHIQHWSRNGFFELVSKYFNIFQARSPLPWTMLLCRPQH